MEALDEFEALLTARTSRQYAGGSGFNIYYLANANCQVVAETLESIFLGGGASAGGGSLLGDIAGNVIGGTTGSLVGSLLGGSSGSRGTAASYTSSVQIIPETRLNALIVRASPADLDLIESMLNYLDTSDLPETQVAPRPRIIPVQNTSAAQIAEIVKEVYSDRLIAQRGSSQRQPSPEEFLQMLRGGGGGSSSGRGGSSRRTATEAAKMSVSVDSRTNALIVSAPNQLFEEVRLFVETLDHSTAESNTAMKVVALKKSNPSTVQKALTSLAGEKVSSTPVSSGSSSSGSSSRGGDSSDWMRRMEEFNRMRSSSGGGSPWSGGGGFPFGGGPSSGPSGFDRSRYFGGSSSGGPSSGSSRDGGSRDSGSSRGRN